MTSNQADVDALVAKLAAMEIMMLTLARPLGNNPNFWASVDAIAGAFQSNSKDVVDAFPQRWEATRGFLDEWKRALNPGN